MSGMWAARLRPRLEGRLVVLEPLGPDDDIQPFAVLGDGSVVGSTSYQSLAPEHLRLESWPKVKASLEQRLQSRQ
jgi:hypothetical protein